MQPLYPIRELTLTEKEWVRGQLPDLHKDCVNLRLIFSVPAGLAVREPLNA